MHDIACETAVRGGSDLHNSAANTPWGYLSFNGARSPIEIHPLCVVYASSRPPTCPALPLSSKPPPPPLLSFLPRRRNRHFTYVYNVPLQATTAHSPSPTVQSHDDKSDSTPTSDPRFVCAVRNALVNQWAPAISSARRRYLRAGAVEEGSYADTTRVSVRNANRDKRVHFTAAHKNVRPITKIVYLICSNEIM